MSENEFALFMITTAVGLPLLGAVFCLICSCYKHIAQETKHVFRALAYGFGGMVALVIVAVIVFSAIQAHSYSY